MGSTLEMSFPTALLLLQQYVIEDLPDSAVPSRQTSSDLAKLDLVVPKAKR